MPATNTNAKPERLYLFHLSSTTIPLPDNRSLEMSLGCYLIQTSNHKNILIDTGIAPDYPKPANHPATRNESTVLDHLSALNLQSADIHTVICTHFDVDHVGYNDHFSQAEFVVQREHFAIARDGHPRFAKSRQHWDLPNMRVKLVDGDTEHLPGLTLLDTPGHVPGHQSVLVRLPQTGSILLAIDAVMMQSQFTLDRKPWPNDDNPDQLQASTKKLLDIVKSENVALTVFGHDGTQWPALRRAPDFYC
jgi:N-acyl homoserine lactone hydrolase